MAYLSILLADMSYLTVITSIFAHLRINYSFTSIPNKA